METPDNGIDFKVVSNQEAQKAGSPAEPAAHIRSLDDKYKVSQDPTILAQEDLMKERVNRRLNDPYYDLEATFDPINEDNPRHGRYAPYEEYKGRYSSWFEQVRDDKSLTDAQRVKYYSLMAKNLEMSRTGDDFLEKLNAQVALVGQGDSYGDSYDEFKGRFSRSVLDYANYDQLLLFANQIDSAGFSKTQKAFLVDSLRGRISSVKDRLRYLEPAERIQFNQVFLKLKELQAKYSV